MKYSFFILLFCVGSFVNAQKTPKACVEQFFIAFHEQDTVKLKKLLIPEVKFQSISKDEKGNSVLHIENRLDFLNSLSSIPKQMYFKEELGKPVVQKDDKMAAVWVPYEFYLDTEFRHCGINLFTLMQVEKKWKIIHFTDTRQIKNCNR
ncbi:nuclear transport factor 2 family protein [Haloflavibacter putidus]|uniref:Nuclear transport factor 2 family protein n=1 Tax=Haloflavibacter putidus TaxID=2576776 RepID=A0A507ZRE4_9FLAO|nr:nuclear transport factor 2 family protein [Haloflavibacter putidus]TQD39121.1 nuclear transport factor 2 family protein [Haloflavibacter putidus]